MLGDALAGRGVLVVKDDWFFADALRRALEEARCSVIGLAPSVGAALALLGTRKPDAAILDVNLGDEVFFPVADALAASGVPFLFATACEARPCPDASVASRLAKR